MLKRVPDEMGPIPDEMDVLWKKNGKGHLENMVLERDLFEMPDVHLMVGMVVKVWLPFLDGKLPMLLGVRESWKKTRYRTLND